MKLLFGAIVICVALTCTSAILPGGCVVTLPIKPTPATSYCPPCNYKCPPEQCSCYFPGTTTLIEPRKVVRPANCEGCITCAMAVQCSSPPGQCTDQQVIDMIKYDSM